MTGNPIKEESGARKFSRRAIFGQLLDRGRSTPKADPLASPEDPNQLVLLRTMACLPFRGSECQACSDGCPTSGAIELERGRPRIVAELCTGCGDCVPLCPAPVGALQMIARS